MSPTQSRKVLVLDSDMIPALAIVRSLGRLGLEVDIASHIDKPLSTWSRHVRQTLTYPNPMQEEAAFIDWVRRVALQNGYALIIPATERTVVPFFKHRQDLDTRSIALPDNESLGIALDKSSTFDLARRLGIPVPQGVTIQDTAQLSGAAQTLAFPIVIKPARSMGSGDHGIVQLAVDYAFNERQLCAMATHALRFGDVILQEYFSGKGTGIELIASHGKIVYAFQHLRLHEVPLTGGGSSLRKSVAIEPALLDAATKLMAALNWHGVAMVEFKWNPDTHDFRLMEINGRFWGSLPLAIASGADFPAMLYELLVQGSITDRPPPKPDVLCRKLSSDLYWHEQVLRGATLPEKLSAPIGRRELLKSIGWLFNPRHRFDIQSLSDPLPGLVDIGNILAVYWGRARDIVQTRLLIRHQRVAWEKGRVAQALARSRNILFVCYGNINRSALAERVYLNKISTLPMLSVNACSAGFHQQAGRPADPNMIEVAHQHGLDMHDCSSRQLDRSMADLADIIFVMEAQHLKRIVEQFPEAAAKTYLLGLADGKACPDGEIADPYGQPPAYYERCFKQVRNCIERLIEVQSTQEASRPRVRGLNL